MLFDTTLQDYLYLIKRKLRIPVEQDNSEWSNASIIDNINMARQEFWNRAGYVMRKGTVSLDSVADTEEITLVNSGIKRINHIRYYDGTDRLPMHFLPGLDYDNLNQNDESGDPYWWTLVKNTLKVYPRPSETLTGAFIVDCVKTLTELTEESDIDVDIETDYRNWIAEWAIGLCWLDAEQDNKASSRFKIAEKMWDGFSYEVHSETLGENIPNYVEVNIDETDERHYTRPLS